MKTFKIIEPTPSRDAEKLYHESLKSVIDDIDDILSGVYMKNSRFEIVNKKIFDIDKALEKVSRYLKDKDFEKIVKKWSEKILRVHIKRWRKSTGILPITIDHNIDDDLLDEMAKRVDYNVSLIVTHGEETKAKIARDVKRFLVYGEGGSIQKIIDKHVGRLGTNYKLISHNETLQFNKQLTEVKALKAGCKEYIYRTSADEKVRTAHKNLNGKKFDLIGTNKGNQALRDINCRCHRKLIFEI